MSHLFIDSVNDYHYHTLGESLWYSHILHSCYKVILTDKPFAIRVSIRVRVRKNKGFARYLKFFIFYLRKCSNASSWGNKYFLHCIFILIFI